MLNRHACPTHKGHHFILDTPLLTKKATHLFIRFTTSFGAQDMGCSSQL